MGVNERAEEVRLLDKIERVCDLLRITCNDERSSQTIPQQTIWDLWHGEFSIEVPGRSVQIKAGDKICLTHETAILSITLDTQKKERNWTGSRDKMLSYDEMYDVPRVELPIATIVTITTVKGIFHL